MRRYSLLMLGVASIALMGVQCPSPQDQGSTLRDTTLKGFASAEELRSFLVTQATTTQYQSGGFGLGCAAAAPVAFSDLAPGPIPTNDQAAEAGGGDGRGNYSTTNIQELGVDESDLVKNDGEMIYMLTGDKVRIVRAAPTDQLAEVATVDIDSYGDSLYLRGKTLIALSQQWAYWLAYYYGWEAQPMMADAGFVAGGGGSAAPGDLVGGSWSDGQQTTVTIFDVTDPAAPVEAAKVKFEGGLVSSRLIENKLHLILTTLPKLPDNPTPASIEAMSLSEWIPDYEKTVGGSEPSSGDIADWPVFFRPGEPNGYGMTVVITLDVDSPDASFTSDAFAGNAGTIYASTESLYLTDTTYSFSDYTYRTDTVVHKLDFTDAGTEYVGSGLVPGRPLNQYSLGEYDGYLRMATTTDEWSSSSGVYVLGQSGDELSIVGKVEGIAPGEQMYAARFVGTRGFLVTFQRMDPLFTIDLSDPTNPQLRGELVVPGYSEHIQMLDDNHLLTIGHAADPANGFAWIEGLQLTVFDITDMDNPKVHEIAGQEAKVTIGGRGTSSEATSNPKAFTWFGDAGLLAFPVDLYEGDTQGWQYGTHEFTGLYVYRVTVEDGFEYLGRIESAEGTTDNNCFAGYYGPTRGVFIDDNVYRVTERGVKVAPVDDVANPLGEIEYSGVDPIQTDCYWEYPVITLPGGAGLE